MATDQELYDMFMDFIRNPHHEKIVAYMRAHETSKGVSDDTQKVHVSPDNKKLMEASAKLRNSYDAWKKKFADEGTHHDAKLDWHFGEDYKLVREILVAFDEYLAAIFGNHEEAEKQLAMGNQLSQLAATPERVASSKFKTILRSVYTDYGGEDKAYKSTAGESAKYTHRQLDDLLKEIFTRFNPK